MDRVDMSGVNRLTLHKHHLTAASRIDNIVRVTDGISGLHATGAQTPYLSLFARMNAFAREQLDDELYVNKRLAKIRCMRGTLYIVTREMLPVAHIATRGFVEKLSLRYAEFQGIGDDQYRATSKRILALLRGREMTVAEIKRELKSDLHLSALLNLMCDQGLLLRIQQGKGWEAKNYRYALLKEYFEDVDLDGISEREAVTRLVASYLKSFGPATETDIAWWTGLPKSSIRAALETLSGKVTRLSIAGLDGEFAALRSDLKQLGTIEAGAQPEVSLLPVLDPYIMGYKQRDRYLDAEHYYYVFDRGGNATSIILHDGRIVGVWDFSDGAEFKVFLFADMKKAVRDLIHSRAIDLGRFMSGKTAKVRPVSKMTPLINRTAGGFMSPLRDTRV